MTFAKGNSTYSKVLGAILRRHVGRHGALSVEQLAERSGVSASIIYELQRERYTASLDAAMALVQALPDEGVEEWHNAIGFFGLRRIDGAQPCFHEAHFEAARTAAAMADFARDGLFDYREQRELATKWFPRLQTALARCVRPKAVAK